MSKYGGFVAAIVVTGLSLAVFAAPSQAAQKRHVHARTGAYDGLWSVSVRTQAGPCDASYRYPARIVGGQLLQAGNDFSYQISGNVVASGAIAVTVSKGLGTATGYGRLHGTIGYGRWSTSNNQCYGTWSAMRRASY